MLPTLHEVPTRRALAAVAAAAGLALIVWAWSAPPGHGNTPVASTATVTTGGAEPALADPVRDPTTLRHEVSCGGTSPITERCTRFSALHSGGIFVDIDAEPGFRGRIHLRLSSTTASLEWECHYEAAGVKERTCASPQQTGVFESGQSVTLRGKTTTPGDDPLEDSYGLWEVVFENR